VKIRTHQLSQLIGQRIVIEIDSWEPGAAFPQGHYIRSLGPVAEMKSEVEALLTEYGANFSPFSASALACLPSVPHPPHEPQAPVAAAAELQSISRSSSSDGGAVSRQSVKKFTWSDSGWCVPDSEIAKRRDIRSTCRVFSVDPPGCQDIDDAMHVRVLPNSSGSSKSSKSKKRSPRRYELGVSIADVAYFVQQDSALDKAARQRGTTSYLPHARFDMLPALLSSDLCSLHGGKDRLAVSVIWEIEEVIDGDNDELFRLATNDDGTIKAWFGRTVSGTLHS
jgi:exosome complex exonuclease DIS3/RRP44